MHCSARQRESEGQINHCSCTNTIPFSLSEILDQNPEIQRNHMNISWTHEHKSSNQHKLTQIRNHSSPIPRFASVSTNQKHIQIIIQPQVFRFPTNKWYKAENKKEKEKSYDRVRGGLEGAAACFLLSTDSKPWRTIGKEKFFFVSFFVDLDFVNDFLQKLFVDLWWEEGEGAFDVKSFRKKKKSKKIPTRWPSGQPPRRNSSDPPSSRRRRAHSRREKRASLSSSLFCECLERGFSWFMNVLH